MSQRRHPFPEKEYLNNSVFGIRFHYELVAIIGNAKDGENKEARWQACINILNYFKEAVTLGNRVRSEVVVYLSSAIDGLSAYERGRLAEALSLPDSNYDVADILERLPGLSPEAEKRLIDKLIAKKGQPGLSHEQENARIRNGAEVFRLYQVYREPHSVARDQTRSLDMEPLERAITDVSTKYNIDFETIRRSYKLFKEFFDLGCVDTNGKFIIHDYQWLMDD